MKEKTNGKKLLSLLLCLVMLVVQLPMLAFATGEDDAPMKRIDSITMNVPTPNAGSNVSTSAPTTPETENYYASELGNYWLPVLASGDSHTKDPYSSEIVFKNNQWYKLSTSIYAEPGYYFDENTTVTVNGGTNEAVIFRLDNYYSPYSNEAVIHAWFSVGTPPTATSVDSIAVTVLETTEKTTYKEWQAEILTELNSQTEFLPGISMVVADLYTMCHSVTGYGYNFQGSRWRSVSNRDNVSVDADHGLLLTFHQDDTKIFSESLTVTVNGKAAEVIYRDDDVISAFLPIGTELAVIEKVDLVVRRNIIEDDTIPPFSEAFEVAGYYDTVFSSYFSSMYVTDLCPFIIKSAEIKDENLNTVTPNAKFEYNTNYWIIADLEAKPGTKFASTVTGSFGGTSGDLRITRFSDTRIGIARLVSSYECVRANISSATSGMIIRFPQPAPDVSYGRGRFYQYGDAQCSVDCYETPYIGCSMITDAMTLDNKYEAGKIYRADFTITANREFRLGETFVPTLFQYTDNSTSETPLDYELMKVTENTPTRYKFSLWFTCGDVPEITTIRNTTINITGPELPTEEDLTFALTDANCRIDGESSVVLAEVNSWNTNGELYLSFQIGPQSGYAFGRNIKVSYNGTPLSVYVNNPNSFRQAYINLMPGGYKVKINGQLEVQGQVDTAYEGTETLQLGLNGANQFRNVKVGDDVTGWVTNIPQGMTAKISKLVYSDEWEDEILAVEIAFEGTPTETKAEPILVTLPADKQYSSAQELTATANEKVTFFIAAVLAHQGEHQYNTEYTSVGADGHAHFCTKDGCTEHDTVVAHTSSGAATEDMPETCTECGYVIKEALGHTCSNHLTEVKATEATCTTAGNKAYYKCTCEKLYTDALGTTETTLAEVTIAALGHNVATVWSTDTTDHWHACTRCDYTEDHASHIPGAEATEDTAQTCTVCDHVLAAKLEHAPMLVEGYEATTTAPGKKDYYHCDSCGKNYADVTSIHEITGDVEAWRHIPMIPAIIEGHASEWTKGTRDGLTFKSNAEFNTFSHIEVDGETVAKTNYTATAGSIIITLKPEYLETLSVGEHLLVVEAGGERAEALFTIKTAGGNNGGTAPTNPSSPQTEGCNDMFLWMALLVASLGGLTTTFLCKKKKTAK